MKRRRPRIVAPPSPGPYVQGGMLEAISEQEKAGRPLAKPVRLIVPEGAPPEVVEWANQGLGPPAERPADPPRGDTP